MNNQELRQQLINIVQALSNIAVKGDDVLTMADVFKGLEYTINHISISSTPSEPVETIGQEE